MMAPAMREGATSRKAPSSAPKRRVSARSSAEAALPVSTTRTSNSLNRARRSCKPTRAWSVSAVRLPISWLWLRSTITATTLFSGSRNSSSRTVLSKASANAARAASRKTAPRCLNQRPASAISAIGTRRRPSHAQERRGSNERDQFTLLPQPFEQHRHVDLIGFIVAGQHVHYDVDAGAQRVDPLHGIGRHRGQ